MIRKTDTPSGTEGGGKKRCESAMIALGILLVAAVIAAPIFSIGTDGVVQETATNDGDNYLSFTFSENGKIHLTASESNPNCEYSFDREHWDTLSDNDIDVVKNRTVYVRGNNAEGFSKYEYESGWAKFVITVDNDGYVSAEGNIMSLIDGTGECKVIPCNYCFSGLFSSCDRLNTAPELPATTLKNSCYNRMFEGCTSLEEAPELPATTLAYYCYCGMFNGCTSLEEAPELPATTLDYKCYCGMFEGCTSLISAPELPATTLTMECYCGMFKGCTSLVSAALPATTLVSSCYYGMFEGCTSLKEAPELPATTLAYSCYYGMFKGCTSLISAPELPATTLAYYCYCGMFEGCTSLKEAPELPATTLAYSCYYGMFKGCTSLISAPELPATTLKDSCYDHMFEGCMSLEEAPELPATTLVSSCYYGMFKGCTSLKKVVCYAVDIKAYYCTNEWLNNVATGGELYTPYSEWEQGDSGIPSGWDLLIQFVVSFNANGGSENPAPMMTMWKSGEKTPLKLPETMTRDRYEFDGWYTKAEGGVKVDFSYTPEGNITLFAHWRGEVYDIEYLDQGGEAFSGMHEGGYPETHTYGTETALKGAKKPGYKFMGWHEDIDCLEPSIVALGETAYTDDIKLYAKWEVEKCMVTFDENGGDTPAYPETIEEIYGSKYILPTTEPTRSGFEFKGWFTDTKGGIEIGSDSVCVATGDHTLYAIWASEEPEIEPEVSKGNKLTMRISYPHGGVNCVYVYPKDGTPEQLGPEDYTVSDDGMEITLTVDFINGLEAGDYSFDVYFEDQSAVLAEFTVRDSPGPAPEPTPGPIPAPIYYEVSYDIAGGSEPGPGTASYEEGAEMYVASYIGYKDGYTFGGWSCNGKTYQAGDEFTVNGDMKFTAIWNASPGPEPTPSDDSNTGLIIGTVVAIVVAVLLIGGAVYYTRKK